MRLLFPYNEILPTRKAHDNFLFHECASLGKLTPVTFFIGKGKCAVSALFSHYNVGKSFEIKRSFLLRKNLFSFSWNLPFFHLTQRYIEKTRPDIVVLSVFKQGLFHLRRKVKGVKYVYEVHELKSYEGPLSKEALIEKEMLSKADLILTTTNELTKRLQCAYNIKTPIVTIPLASSAKPLPATSQGFTLTYVGQLYEGQGISLLLKALAKAPVSLKIIGGKKEEIVFYTKRAQELNIEKWVSFLGFVPPSQLPLHLENTSAFVAPFEPNSKMKVVAHTKLVEYIRYGKPIIAPDLPVVKECLDQGALYFTPGDENELSSAIKQLQEKALYTKLHEEIGAISEKYTWEKRSQKIITTFDSI